jgi:hypothetical protein
MPRTIPVGTSAVPRREGCALLHKQVRRAAQMTNATVPDTDVSFQIGGLCYLERDALWLDRHPALAFCLSMIFSENRQPLFRIML